MSDRDPPASSKHLRLIRPQWQGPGSLSVRALFRDLPFDAAGAGTRSARGSCRRCCPSTIS